MESGQHQRNRLDIIRHGGSWLTVAGPKLAQNFRDIPRVHLWWSLNLDKMSRCTAVLEYSFVMKATVGCNSVPAVERVGGGH